MVILYSKNKKRQLKMLNLESIYQWYVIDKIMKLLFWWIRTTNHSPALNFRRGRARFSFKSYLEQKALGANIRT